MESSVLPIGLTPDRVRAVLADGGRSLVEGKDPSVPKTGGVLAKASPVPQWFAAEPVRYMINPVVRVTPALATQWLSRNEGNRKPSKAKIERYAAMMRDGEWNGGNGETIKFSKLGRLLDGQSRLRAVVLCQETVEMEVVLNLEEQSQSTMDTGEVRSLNHALQIRGYKNLCDLGSGLRLLWGYLHNPNGFTQHGLRTSVTYMTHRQAVDLLENHHPGLLESLTALVRYGAKYKPMMPLGPLSVLHYLMGRIDPVERDLFFDSLRDGVGLQANDPILMYRERVTAAKMEGHPMHKTVKIALLVKCWNIRRGADSLPLAIRKGATTPKLDGCTIAGTLRRSNTADDEGRVA
ncbi:MAG: hypothetical protein ABQ298_03635 [Puniceicoccaceae bacterium]